MYIGNNMLLVQLAKHTKKGQSNIQTPESREIAHLALKFI